MPSRRKRFSLPARRINRTVWGLVFVTGSLFLGQSILALPEGYDGAAVAAGAMSVSCTLIGVLLLRRT